MEPIKILLPTDFSPQAEHALVLARKIAEKVPANLELLHIIPCRTEARLNESGQVEVEEDSVQGYLNAQVVAARKGFEMYNTSAFSSVKHDIVFGPIASTIVMKTPKGAYDLIIMGTKGAFGMKEFFSGSSTQQVVRGSQTPVLSLMCDRSDWDVKNVLLIHQLDNKQAQIPKALKALVKAFGSTLHIFSNNDPKSAVSESAMKDFLEKEGLSEENTVIHPNGISEQQIIHFDQRYQMDLIAVATEGRSALSQIFRADVAEKLVNHMYKPIMSFHI
ncbi:MAG: universal stress protein [Cryomorphaceae bacterium]|nr:universal stress protein [Cryomorphaceae bacterium]